MFRVSLANLVAAVATTFTPSSEDAAYPATNVKVPQRPFMPWKTTGTGSQSLTIDFGGSVTLDVLALINANFAEATIGSDSIVIEDFGNPWNGRYSFATVFATPYTGSSITIAIPSQTPVDGDSVYSLGGVWAGALAETPRDIKWGYEITEVEPHEDAGPQSGAWRERLELGEPLNRIRAKLQTLLTPDVPPALNDQLEGWLTLNREIRRAGAVLITIEDDDPRQCWVAQRISSNPWTVRPSDQPVAEAEIEFEEMDGPDFSKPLWLVALNVPLPAP